MLIYSLKDQQHFLNLDSLLGMRGSILISSDTLIPTVCSDISPVYSSFKIFSANWLNANSTFLKSLALISRKLRFYFFANALPSSVLTCRSSSKSILFPTKRTCIDALPFNLTSSSHSCKCSKVSRLNNERDTV